MGGTSLDISVIRNGAAQLTNTLYVQWGIPIRTPAIDVKTIGAGGGSIVWIDEGARSASARTARARYPVPRATAAAAPTAR